MSHPREPFIAFETEGGNWSYLVPDGKDGFRENGRFKKPEDAKYSATKAKHVFDAAQSGAGAITGQGEIEIL